VAGSNARPTRSYFAFLVFPHLLHQVPLVAQFLDEVHLGFQEVDVAFFVLEERHQQVARPVVGFLGGDGHGIVVLLHRRNFQRQIAFQHSPHRPTHRQFQRLHGGTTVEKQDSFDQHFGVFHLADGLLLDVFGELVVAPVLAHFRVQKVLVDGGQLFAQSLIQFSKNFRISFHSVQSIAKERM
jgi:hypothetical protein